MLHHSGTSADSSARQIAQYHISLGWPGIGYHFVVRRDGTIEWANDLAYMSYNVASRNHEVVGICLPGDFTTQAPKPAQLASAQSLVRWLLATKLPGRLVVGHKEIALPVSPTSCPGAMMDYFRQ